MATAWPGKRGKHVACLLPCKGRGRPGAGTALPCWVSGQHPQQRRSLWGRVGGEGTGDAMGWLLLMEMMNLLLGSGGKRTRNEHYDCKESLFKVVFLHNISKADPWKATFDLRSTKPSGPEAVESSPLLRPSPSQLAGRTEVRSGAAFHSQRKRDTRGPLRAARPCPSRVPHRRGCRAVPLRPTSTSLLCSLALHLPALPPAQPSPTVLSRSSSTSKIFTASPTRERSPTKQNRVASSRWGLT